MALKNLIKTLVLALLVITLPAGVPARAAGTTPLALAIQFDSQSNVASNCKLNFYVAGTVATPQNAYADFGLTTPLPQPLSCDQSGRVPMHWLADGLIHLQLTDANGLSIIDTTMQVLGPSSGGGGGGGTVDPTSVNSTGDLKVKYGTGPIAGWVRTNGLTIGNAVSGATERANSDTQAAFIYLYNCGDATLVVSSGRTGNALNDYNAGKTITVPDYAGQGLAALDDQGAGQKGRLSASFFGTATNVLGAAGGTQSHAMILAEAPVGIQVSGLNSISVAGSNSFSASGVNSITTSGSTSGSNTINASGINNVTVTSTNTSWVNSGGNPLSSFAPGGGGSSNYITGTAGFVSAVASAGTNTINVSGSNTINTSGSFSGDNTINVAGSVGFTSTGSNTINGTSTNTGGSAFATIPPLKLATIYMKL